MHIGEARKLRVQMKQALEGAGGSNQSYTGLVKIDRKLSQPPVAQDLSIGIEKTNPVAGHLLGRTNVCADIKGFIVRIYWMVVLLRECLKSSFQVFVTLEVLKNNIQLVF
jgi:hypothetical protein